MIVYYQNYRLNCKFVGVKAAPFDDSNTNQNTVVVTNCDTGKWTMFDFWGSRANPEINSRADAINAFECFLSDVDVGNMTFEEFCNEFGYDTDSRKAKKIHRLCQKSARKFDRIS